MILPGILSGILPQLLWAAPCAALTLVATRMPVVRFRSLHLHLAPVVVCALVLWVGALAGAIGAIVAGWVEARMFYRDRPSRVAALKFALGLTLAAGAAGIVAAVAPVHAAQATSQLQFVLGAWARALPTVAAFLAVYGVCGAALEKAYRPSTRCPAHAPAGLRFGVTSAGFTTLAAVVPFGAAYGTWALLPLAGLLFVMGLLIRRAFEVSRLRKQLAASQAMGLASLADAATCEPTALLYRFLDLAETLVHADRSIVWLVDEVHDEIVPAAGLPNMGDFAGLRMRYGEGLIGTAAERSRPMIVSDAARTLRRGENEPAADSWLLFPILSQNRVLGVAQWTRPASMPFTEADAEQLEGLVPHVGVAVESLRARNKIRELAATDSLTGLHNMRRIGELLRDEMRRSERYNRPLSVLMLDVDSFKSFNDTYGHPAGDELLKSVARILRSGVRTVDRVGRYGGEEFTIVMPETHKDDAFMLAERIRSAVEQQAYIIIGGEEIHRTVSVGVASYPEDGLNPQEVISRADEALYRAKHSGRNCVMWA